MLATSLRLLFISFIKVLIGKEQFILKKILVYITTQKVPEFFNVKLYAMNSACLTTRNNLINKFTISLFNYP
jgi:hypothetical protein